MCVSLGWDGVRQPENRRFQRKRKQVFRLPIVAFWEAMFCALMVTERIIVFRLP